MGIRVITVSRQFGSGGRTIAKETAERLGWAYYDKELVKKIAAESGLAESYILESGEYACSTSSFLFNWVMNAEGARSGSLPISDQLYIIQHNIIKDLAEKERCVIVGRCADYVLRDRPDCLHTFFHADTAFRADRIVRLYGERPEKPEKRLEEKDDKRRAYYRHYTGHQWGLAETTYLPRLRPGSDRPVRGHPRERGEGMKARAIPRPLRGWHETGCVVCGAAPCLFGPHAGARMLRLPQGPALGRGLRGGALRLRRLPLRRRRCAAGLFAGQPGT